MTPTDVANLISRTARRQAVDERVDLVVVKATLVHDATRREWIALRNATPAFIDNVTIRELDTGAELEEDDEPDAAIVFRITVAKAGALGSVLVFHGRSIAAMANEIATADHVRSADMPTDATFTTHRARFSTWTLDPPAPYAPMEKLHDPRLLSDDFTKKDVIPDDIRPWLVFRPPETRSVTYAAWRQLAVPRLAATIADRVSLEADAPVYYFLGPPRCAVTPSKADLIALYPRLVEGITWTFLPGSRDTDTRHLLLAAEWARSHRADDIRALGNGSLESARSAYDGYVKSGSKETLKALTDLRKTTLDEAQKASQKAQDMTAGLWKDVALAAVPFVLKIIPDASKLTSQWLTVGMAFAAAAFLTFSFAIQIVLNKRYLRGQKLARALWRDRLNQVLSAEEVQKFAEDPIRRSVDDYRTIRLAVGAVYVVLIVLLIAFGISELPASEPVAPRMGVPSS